MSENFYNDHATQLADLYLSKGFEQVHSAWLEHLTPILTKDNARILDLGAGAGRDSKRLAELGQANNICVTAIEPAQSLAKLGKSHTQGLNVHWLHDSLPALAIITKKEISFDLILLSAVWMHIPETERAHAIGQLATLLKPAGKLVISLRHGESTDQRIMHKVCADELIKLGCNVALEPVLVTDKQADVIGRAEVHWQTVVLQHSSANGKAGDDILKFNAELNDASNNQ